MTRPIRVLIVDDHPIVRDGLRGALEAEFDVEVVGEAGDGEEGVTMADRLDPDLVLMDLRMPRMDGIAAIRRLRARMPRTKVLVLTTFDADSDVLPAIEAGATGYLLKDAPTEELLHAVRGAARGEPVLSPSAANRLMCKVRRPAGGLTQREIDVLTLVAKGNTNRTAARNLFISEASVKTHLLHIYGKLGVRDRASAVAEAYRQGLIE
ncbi:response regulator [Amycolatopsis suaedae]|uniref:Response regulator transcription factor n=1 Tax=Amycolatopsis suaedae TaxID=2510978 RepID=A0A4Q7J7G6_9PSEU|nr:response regulator transcription factor [Amycolatopsis suaedae]RZQ62293.1 response regulator transcription factor [Amycolatopsis suaedae]